MTFEQYEKADKLLKEYQYVLEGVIDITRRCPQDSEMSNILNDCYTKLTESLTKKIENI